MWRAFRSRAFAGLRLPRLTTPVVRNSAIAIGTSSLLLGGSIVVNDASANSLDGVSVDDSIDPLPNKIRLSDSKILTDDYTLIASGMRTVTFLGFKVYAVGLYVPTKDAEKVRTIGLEYMKSHPTMTAVGLFDDRKITDGIINDMVTQVPYAIRITPVRNTDFSHLRDGLTKSILAHPEAKSNREEVSKGVQQLREVFDGFRGSVPKGHNLWICSAGNETVISYEGKKSEELGVIKEPCIARIILLLYLSNNKPLSQPFRKNFVSYMISIL